MSLCVTPFLLYHFGFSVSLSYGVPWVHFVLGEAERRGGCFVSQREIGKKLRKGVGIKRQRTQQCARFNLSNIKERNLSEILNFCQ